MTDYLLVPKPGKSASKVSKQPDDSNAWVDVVGPDGVVDRFDATPRLVRNLEKANKLKKPEDYLPRKEFRREGEKEKTPRLLPEGKLSRGINPYHQLIYSTVQKQGGASFEDIIRSLVNGYRVIPHTPYHEREVGRMIEKMRRRALLTKKEGVYHIGISMDFGEMVDFERGYDPRAKKTVDRARHKLEGGVSFGEVQSYLMDYLGWVENAGNVEKILNHLKSNGVLEEEPENWFKAKGRLEPYG